jgi:ferredoxin
MACKEEKPACFCAVRGIDKSASSRCDAFLTGEEDGYTLRVLTEAAENLFTGAETEAKKFGPPPTVQLKSRADESEVFETMPWEDYAMGCIGCGTCTYLCPTCHCFEIKDTEVDGEVTRRRLWDSCMYPRFTLHAGGHNPRATKRERFRQRVLHKYVYIPENYGLTACTGCGRCIRSCPGGLNIKNTVADIMKRTGGMPHEQG